MNHELNYANEKLYNAVDCLVGAGNIHDRLHSAYMSFHPLQERDFKDPGMLSKWQSIMARLTAVKTGDPKEGFVKNTLNQMPTPDAVKLARDIVELAYEVKDAVVRSR